MIVNHAFHSKHNYNKDDVVQVSTSIKSLLKHCSRLNSHFLFSSSFLRLYSFNLRKSNTQTLKSIQGTTLKIICLVGV